VAFAATERSFAGEARAPSNSSRIIRATVTDAVTLETPHLELGVSRRTGAFYIKDKATGEVFGSGAERNALARLTVGKKVVWLDAPQSVRLRKVSGAGEIRARFGARADQEAKSPSVTFTFVALPSGRDIVLRASVEEPKGKRQITSACLFDGALWLSAAEPGYLVVPHALGCLLDAKTRIGRRWRSHQTRDSLTMQMFGVVKNGSALVISWDDLDAEMETKTHGASDDLPQRIALSLWHARSVRLRVCGAGDYVTVAQHYREVAKEKGLLAAFSERVKKYPALAKLASALEVKSFVKSGTAANSRFSKDGKERHRVNLTFDDTAAIVKHLRDDLGIERCLFVLAGWIRGGYDFSHPDIWPPDDDLGGPEGLARVAKVAKDAGYLFGLHDNYDMMFKAQPAANKDDAIGEHNSWAGGPQYVIHPKRQKKYAQRNLELIKRCCAPNAYFCDQITALPLYRTNRKDLPLTYQGCVDAYRDLIRCVKAVTGVMGSEDGQEWAVPYLDYHEGILSPEFYPKRGRPVPLFDLVYHDCAALFWHQGFGMALHESRTRWGGGRAKPEHYLKLLSLARTPIFKPSDAPKRWWAQPTAPRRKPPARPLGDGAHFSRTRGKSAGAQRPAVNAHPPWKGFRGEVHGAYKLALPQAGHLELRFAIGLRDGIRQTDGVTFRIEVNGNTLFAKPWAKAAWSEHRLDITQFRGKKAAIAFITNPNANANWDWALWAEPRVVDDKGTVIFDFIERIADAKAQMVEIPREQRPPDNVFARADNGWAEGMHPIDAMLKNTCEFLCPTNELAFYLPITAYQERPDGLIRTVFGDGQVEVAVNLGSKELEYADATLPPRSGFIVRAATFLAFHATSFRGIRYPKAALFTVRGLDGRPLDQSARLRVFHGFGPSSIALRTKRNSATLDNQALPVANAQFIVEVKKEAVVKLD